MVSSFHSRKEKCRCQKRILSNNPSSTLLSRKTAFRVLYLGLTYHNREVDLEDRFRVLQVIVEDLKISLATLQAEPHHMTLKAPKFTQLATSTGSTTILKRS